MKRMISLSRCRVPAVSPTVRRHVCAHLLIGAVLFFITPMAPAQNPSFAGNQFKQIWSDAVVPQGASGSPRIVGSSDLYMTSAGVFLDSRTYEIGMYYFDDSGAYTVATKAQPEFSSAGFFRFIGANPDGSMLIWPVANNDIYPCQIYDSNGLSAITAPTPQQALSLGNYFDGRFVFLEELGLGAVQIGYYSEGNPVGIWLDNTDFSDLASILDYDGEILAFVTGTAGNFDIRLREADGTLTYILGMGDSLPGTVSSTYTGTPSAETIEVDQGKVYIQGAGSGGELILFSSSDGITFDVVAEVGQSVPGLTGVNVTAMTLRQVRNGKIWLQVSQSDGDKVLYQIVGSVWTRVAGLFDSYDGRVPSGFGTYEHGFLGDAVVVAVQFLNFSSPTIFDTELYVNGDLPGFTAAPSGPALHIVQEPGGSLIVSSVGDPGSTNTLQATSSLTNTVWDIIGTVVADGAGVMEWTLSPTHGARFYRLIQE